MQYQVTPLVAALSICLISTSAWAADDNDEVMRMKRELLNLKHKVERLEKSRRTEEIPKAEDNRGVERSTELSGLVEVETGSTDSANGGAESDLSVSTVELGLNAQVTPWVNGHVLILFEEDETDPPEIDEAIVTLANPGASPWSLAAGRMYVLFGNYDSALISDPLTLEIGETRETAVQAGWGAGNFQALAWAANGDTNDGGNEHIDLFGVGLDYGVEGGEDQLGYALGLSCISNLADSDSLQETVTDPDNLTDAVAGWSAHAALHWKTFTLIGEYLAAADDFDAADLAFNGAGARPSAWNLEVDYGFELAGREAGVAVAWQRTEEALALELPETRWLAALSVGIHDQTTLALECAHDEDYSVDDGGSGEDTDTVTLQLAVAF